MSIALESGPRLGGGGGGGPRFGRVARCGAAYAVAASPPASGGRGGSSSVGRGSSSPAAAAQWEWDGEEVEGGDGEVQSSYKGSPFDTMDALQDALPRRSVPAKVAPLSGSSACRNLGSAASLLGIRLIYLYIPCLVP